MSPLYLMTPIIVSLFLFWALMICFTAVVCIVYAVYKKQMRYVYTAVPCLMLAYILWQIMMDVRELYRGNLSNSFVRNLDSLPWIFYVILLSIATITAVCTLRDNIFFSKSHITPDAIRICADSLPCGICYWHENGRIEFANECITSLCFRILGGALQNGNEFSTAVTDPIMHIENEVWSFKKRTVDLKGVKLTEMVATNITELYDKTVSLKKEKEEVEKYNNMLHEYNLRIDETVRRQEIMNAKISIHDEMNKLMLATAAAGQGGVACIDDVFVLWKNNAILLCGEASENEKIYSIEELTNIAKALKIEIVWKNNIPKTLSQAQLNLFFTAAQEALANAFKHARANTLEIEFIINPDLIVCNFSNNGQIPVKPVIFTGGLSNLKVLAEMQGAKINAKTGDCFTLSLLYPKKA